MSKLNYNESSRFDEKKNHFGMFQFFFLDLGFHKITRQVNIICVVFHSLALLLQIIYIITHSTIKLLSHYSTILLVSFSGIATMLLSVHLEKYIWELHRTHLAISWSNECAGEEVSRSVEKWAKKINAFAYSCVILFQLSGLAAMPFFGNVDELFLAPRVFRSYFGDVSFIPHCLYFATTPFFVYSIIRHGYSFLYGLVSTQHQMKLVNEHLLRLCEDLDENEESYQDEIAKRLSFCIRQHIALKDCLLKTHESIKGCLPFMVILTIFSFGSTIFFILNYFLIMSFITKVRLLFMAVSSVLLIVIFCYGGQGLIDESDLIFETIAKYPWYNWNAKIKKMLLIFMVNSSAIKFHFGGISLNYRLAFDMMRTSYSIASLFFYFNSEFS